MFVNLTKRVNYQTNCRNCFGNFEENMDLSCVYLAVICCIWEAYLFNQSFNGNGMKSFLKEHSNFMQQRFLLISIMNNLKMQNR